MTTDAAGVLDTSAVIVLERLDPATLPATPVITAVTLAELSVGPLATTDELERQARQRRLQQVEATFDPLPFDAAAARSFASVALSLRRAGRKASARAFDAMIAAIAITHSLPIYTTNLRDFEGIDGLRAIAVTPR